MHRMQAMVISHQQVQLDALIAQAQVNDRELGQILGVNQSTAWRLRNGHINKIEPTCYVFERISCVREQQGGDDASLIADLVALSTRVPALRDALLALQRIMRDTA